MSSTHTSELAEGARFPFGKNWTRFLQHLNEARIADAEQSLRTMLGVSLAGKRFLDIGCGSGLFSLAARRLGADVWSMDFDPACVACTCELRRRFFPDDPRWQIHEASVLDSDRMASYRNFDVVYSWGVLHHTGDMLRALDNAAMTCAPGGLLFIAIYNDQGLLSEYWHTVKRIYNRNALGRWLMTIIHAPYLLFARLLVRILSGRSRLARGMTLYHDMVDWLGGLPFEVARPEVVFRFCRDRGFLLQQLTTCGGRMGCNEFVFRRNS
jgi:2-polyprenyl-6-hydroxyphenyl methylase/3-demethylubiquinone-9 3-methyltransferase